MDFIGFNKGLHRQTIVGITVWKKAYLYFSLKYLVIYECDCLIAFWDGTSRSTKYTIDYAHQLVKPIMIVNYITNEITRL